MEKILPNRDTSDSNSLHYRGNDVNGKSFTGGFRSKAVRVILLNFSAMLLILAVTNSIAFSQSQDDFKPTYTIGGTVFTGWQSNIDNADYISKLDTSSAVVDNNQPFGYNPTKNQFETSKNSFYLERAYINVKAALTPQITARLTPDIFSYTDQSGRVQFAYQVKFAYVDYTPLSLDNGTSLSFTLGVQSNQWISNIDRISGYRFVAKSLTDYPWLTSASRSGNNVVRTTGSYFSSADLGLTTKFTFPNKFSDLYVAVVNGNGYRNLSFDNRFKDVQFTGFMYPLANTITKKTNKMKKDGKTRFEGISDLILGGFAYLGKLDKGENYSINGVQYKRDRFGGMFYIRYNFKNTGFVRFGGEMSFQDNQDPAASKQDSAVLTNASGLNAYLEFCPPVESLGDKLSLYLRYDFFDPNTSDNADTTKNGFNSSNDKQNLFIVGLFYKTSKYFTFGFSYHMASYQDNFVVKYDGTPTDKLDRLYLNTVLDF